MQTLLGYSAWLPDSLLTELVMASSVVTSVPCTVI